MSVRRELDKLHRALGGRRAFEIAAMSDAELLAAAERAAARIRARGPADLSQTAAFLAANPEYRAWLDQRFADVSDDELRAMFEGAKAAVERKRSA